MRRLRMEDPVQWSVHALARKYNCSPIFVTIAVQSSKEHRRAMRGKLAEVKDRWGPIRTKARDDRRKRRDMLYRGEI